MGTYFRDEGADIDCITSFKENGNSVRSRNQSLSIEFEYSKAVSTFDTVSYKSLVYTSSKDKIAAIAPLVIQEARDGNDDAHEIMMQAGKELARITVNVYNKLNFKHSTPIAVSGSILRLVPEIFAVFKKWCEESMKEITLVSQAEMAVKGTYYLMRDIYFLK